MMGYLSGFQYRIRGSHDIVMSVSAHTTTVIDEKSSELSSVTALIHSSTRSSSLAPEPNLGAD